MYLRQLKAIPVWNREALRSHVDKIVLVEGTCQMNDQIER
jgi:hypothetical protein